MFRSYVRQFARLTKEVRNWPVYVLQRYGISKTIARYRLRGGPTVILRPSVVDLSALNEVWLDRSYDPNAFGISFDWAAAKTVVDVGGHVGTFTLFAGSMSKNTRIVTLEPDPENFKILAMNVAENGLLTRTSLHNVGLGDGQPITLYTFPNDRGGNSAYRADEGGTPVMIETISLQSLFQKERIDACDYLKLDCEGAEYEALYRCPPEILRRIRCIGMEYHHFSKNPTHDSVPLQAFLETAGYRCVRHKKSMMMALRD